MTSDELVMRTPILACLQVLFNSAEAQAQCNRRLLAVCDHHPTIEPSLLGGRANPCLTPGDGVANFRKLWAAVKAGQIWATTRAGRAFALSPAMLSYYMPSQLYDTSGDQWLRLVSTLTQLGSANASERAEGAKTVLDGVCGPRWFDFGYCVAYMQPALTTVGVRGQDAAGRYTATQALTFIKVASSNGTRGAVMGLRRR